MGVRPALQLCCFRELRRVLLQGDSPEAAAFPGIRWGMTGVAVAAAVLGLRCPQAVGAVRSWVLEGEGPLTAPGHAVPLAGLACPCWYSVSCCDGHRLQWGQKQQQCSH